jgi:hypothetical protein
VGTSDLQREREREREKLREISMYIKPKSGLENRELPRTPKSVIRAVKTKKLAPYFQ